MASLKIKKITICGFGLIGSSMALDFLKGHSRYKLFAFDRPAVLKRLSKDKRFKVSRESNFSRAIAGAGVIVLAAPHKANEQMLTRLSQLNELKDCLIVDTGAVKQPISKLSAKLKFPDGTQFLSTHPMAGREKAGFENSAANLFENHSWFLDEDVTLNSKNKTKLDWMIKQLKAKPTYIANRLHDELMSEISHLPQLISTILGGQVNPTLIPLAGPGLRSMLRLAGSPYSVWSEIIDENRIEIIKALKLFGENLSKVTSMIKKGESLEEVFQSASRSYRCL